MQPNRGGAWRAHAHDMTERATRPEDPLWRRRRALVERWRDGAAARAREETHDDDDDATTQPPHRRAADRATTQLNDSTDSSCLAGMRSLDQPQPCPTDDIRGVRVKSCPLLPTQRHETYPERALIGCLYAGGAPAARRFGSILVNRDDTRCTYPSVHRRWKRRRSPPPSIEMQDKEKKGRKGELSARRMALALALWLLAHDGDERIDR